MKHLDFSRPLRLINPPIKGKKKSYERIFFTKTVMWPRDPKKFHDSQTKRRFQK